MVLEYLKTRGRVIEEMEDLTERAMAGLRNRRASSSHLGQCPAEAARGVVMRGVVSVYAQYRQKVTDGDEPTRTGRPSLTLVGVLCVSCGYHQIDQALIGNPQQARRESRKPRLPTGRARVVETCGLVILLPLCVFLNYLYGLYG